MHIYSARKGGRAWPMLVTVLAALLALIVAPSTALADTSGTCGQTDWSFSGNTVTISPTRGGSMGSQEEGEKLTSALPRYDVTRAVVQEGVTNIAGCSFNGLYNLSSVQLPSTLVGFGDANIPNGGGGYIFAETDVTSITIPAKLSYVIRGDGGYAFAGAIHLREVTITSGMQTIPRNLFNGETSYGSSSGLNIKTVHIPATVTAIGDNAFHSCGVVGDVWFGGTADQWYKISIGENNEGIKNGETTVHFADSGLARLSGSDRYNTMATIVSAGFYKSNWAVLATGDNFPDALAASALAGAKGCPVVLTATGSLSPQAEQKLRDLDVSYVYILGGTSAVSESVENYVRNNLGIYTKRIAGATRIMTSIATMAEVRTAYPSADTVIIATGKTFADSLSIGPWSYVAKAPIVLTNDNGTLTDDAIVAIKSDKAFKNVIIVGGTSAVSDSVRSQLGDGYSFRRLSGKNRYETSRVIADWTGKNGLGWSAPAITTGEKSPDALAGAALCGSKRSVMVLVSGPQESTISLLKENKAAVNQAYILGGTSAVSAATATAVANALK